jgi:maleate isomerase
MDKSFWKQRPLLHAKVFIEGSGFKVTSTKGLGLTVPYQVANVDSDEMYTLSKQVAMEDPGADVVFITCTGLTVVPIIERLEAETKKRVITSKQAVIWASLRRINVNDGIKGFGILGDM